MFFPVSKLLGFFALPSNLLVVLGLLGIVLLVTRWRRAGLRLVVASLLLVALLGWSPLGNALLVPLEDRFPPVPDDGRPVAGIVVLGGAVTPDVAEARGIVVLNEAAERLTAAATLARRHPSARIVHSGGDPGFLLPDGNESAVALRLLAELGVPAAQLVAEDRSRNTVENAVYSKTLTDPKPGERWLLVTSAYHMPRAIGVFRRAGFPVEAYPVDVRTRGRVDLWRPFPTIGDGLRRTDTAMREWVGLLVYRLTGKSSALFPGPEGG
ncbi:YdcF family protein [Rhodoplanes serenus]|uniref:YdcF family protein n=1 Tax=Rhodoplanes serenus TaxID=200615 RepID=A0A9X4XLY3_9BRAD|nr:YdcF family protein [Rhodoplanes serenus]MTW16551.1 YdcF family protein [Rhodoplanes serenus]